MPEPALVSTPPKQNPNAELARQLMAQAEALLKGGDTNQSATSYPQSLTKAGQAAVVPPANLGIASGALGNSGFAVQYGKPREADSVKLLAFQSQACRSRSGGIMLWIASPPPPRSAPRPTGGPWSAESQTLPSRSCPGQVDSSALTLCFSLHSWSASQESRISCDKRLKRRKLSSGQTTSATSQADRSSG